MSRLDKALFLHIVVHKSKALGRAGQGKQWLVLVMAKDALKILHDQRETGIIVPFLLGQHQPQGHGRLHRLKAFY